MIRDCESSSYFHEAVSTKGFRLFPPGGYQPWSRPFFIHAGSRAASGLRDS